MRKLKKNGGFTLIEMLIVVAIIAILIAISIPMVNKALENAREATDSANERSALGLAMIEVLSEGKLAGVEVDDTAKSAWYVISDEHYGSLSSSATKPTTGCDYGKGTSIGPNETPHVGEGIKITYDPTQTDPNDQFKIEWE